MTVFKRSQNSLGAAIFKNALATWPHCLTCLNDVNLDSIHSRSSSTFEDDFWMVGLLLGVSKARSLSQFPNQWVAQKRIIWSLAHTPLEEEGVEAFTQARIFSSDLSSLFS